MQLANPANKIIKHKSILTGEELTVSEIQELLSLAHFVKAKRNHPEKMHSLANKHLALIFNKASLRTRFSFTVAMRELGGDVVESIATTRKTETAEDFIRVLGGYCHAAMIRTDNDVELIRMQKVSRIPIINGLSDLHHPCQILSDIFTLVEIFPTLEKLKVSYIGDGNNVLHSLLLLLPQIGIDLHYCCPASRQPDALILQRAQLRAQQTRGSITAHQIPQTAVKNTHVVYTDVWVSMGFENKINVNDFAHFQVNEALMQHAAANAVFMHCMPMQRGQEVSETLPDQPCSVIFQQSENRLHMQKALLIALLT